MTAESDALGKMQTLLSGQWNSANTDSILPNFYVSGEAPPRLDFATGGTSVLIYLPSHTTDPNGLGPLHKERTVDRVSLDIRTKVCSSGDTTPRGHGRKVYNECRRIFASRINDPFGDQSFLQLMPIGFVDFTTQNFFRYVYDVYLRNWTVTR